MLLSVVVTVVDGGAALTRCLDALAGQRGAPQMEVIVPYDDGASGVAEIARRFTSCRFLNLGTLHTSRPKAGPAGQHELFDRRRAAGLAAATGSLVAILEDRGVPRPHWAAALVKLHLELPHGVIGGAIENGCDRLRNWAVYFCDFGRYQLPFSGGPRPYVSDVNVSYKRRALDQTASLWKDRYHEPIVHDAIVESGDVLFLSPELVVDQVRDNLRIGAMVRERFAWGQLFATLRAHDIGRARRSLLAIGSAVLPAVLLLRLARDRVVKRRARSRFLAASPIVLLLLCAWSAGEAVGYLSGRS